MDYITILITFAICFISYRSGLRDGQRLRDNKVIEPTIKSPLKAIEERREIKESNQTQKEFADAIENLLAYDGSKQKEVKR